MLSADGSTVAFVAAGQTAKIMSVKSDGTGLVEVDSYTPGCYCNAFVDISANGQTIVSSESVQLRLVKAGAKVPLLTLGSNELREVHITADGGVVFFAVRRDTSYAAGPIERGIWAIGSDGTGLRKVVGPAAVAAVTGVTADKIFPFDNCHLMMGISADGARVVFSVPTGTGKHGVFLVNGDGTDLRQLAETTGGFHLAHQVAISADGKKIAYNIDAADGYQLATINADGTGKAVIPIQAPAANPGCQAELQLDGSGSRLFLSELGLLMSADGSTQTQVSTRGGFWSSDPAPAANGGMWLGTGNSTLNRFVHKSRDSQNIGQVVLVEVDPLTLGDAPSVSEARATATTLPADSQWHSTVSAKVVATGTLNRVSIGFLRNGYSDATCSSDVLLDNGTQGDLTKEDQVFTSHQVLATTDAKPGARSLRIKAESSVAGRRHATAIETSGWQVVAR